MWLYSHEFLPFVPYCIIQGLNGMHIFIIYHDAGHNSFFTSPFLNLGLNWFLSFFIGTPLYWVIYHKLHHGRSGDLSKKPKEWNDTIFFTVEQYNALPKWVRIAYRIFRDPFVFFSIVPLLNWYVKYRIPVSFNPPTRELTRYQVFFHSLMNTIGLYFVYRFAYYLTGVGFYGYFLGLSTGATFGMILFHMQHSFNPGYVVKTKWNLRNSALIGSSLLTIPWWMKSWTMGIEYHHIHHYSTLVPGYYLQQCHEEGLQKDKHMWDGLNVIDYSKMLDCLKYTLYDDKNEKFVGFSEVN